MKIKKKLKKKLKTPRCPTCGLDMIKTTWAMDEAIYVMWMCPSRDIVGHITPGVLEEERHEATP